MTDWLKIAMRRDVVIRGIKVGVIVGTILAAINHGDLIIERTLSPESAWKIARTYLVPYCVSTYAGVSAIINNNEKKDS